MPQGGTTCQHMRIARGHCLGSRQKDSAMRQEKQGKVSILRANLEQEMREKRGSIARIELFGLRCRWLTRNGVEVRACGREYRIRSDLWHFG